jgi:cytochrome c553
MMKNASASYKNIWLVTCLAVAILCLNILPSEGGTYGDSAHGNPDSGVDRADIDAKYANFASGNCAHCHEAHASIAGAEPDPAGSPAPHTLFAESFDTSQVLNLYQTEDDFCFYCHNDSSGPRIVNQDYSRVFGGGTDGEGPQSILDAFNQTSYHNLNDIYNFLTNSNELGNNAPAQDVTPEWFDWFDKRKNPCSACHNSHLVKRNWDSSQPNFPLLSVISIPGVSTDNLWGEDIDNEVMSIYAANKSAYYEAPYALDTTNREPGEVGNEDGDNTPDYVSFCTSCHNDTNFIYSTTLSRELSFINWDNFIGLNQDKHGSLERGSDVYLRDPYAAAAAIKNNFVLSCLDCHEPHGSGNIMLLRARINSEDLEGTVDSTNSMSYVCKRCHQDDEAAQAGAGEADHWEYVHHIAPDAPYIQQTCGVCHQGGGMSGVSPIPCDNCHGHGMTDSWLPPSLATGRVTF